MAPKQLKYLSLFSGIGGFEIGLRRASYKCPDEAGRQTEPDEDLLQVRQRQTVPALPRGIGGDGSAEEDERGLLPADQRRIRPICIGYSEIDKYAIKVYERQFNDHKNYGDITAINPDELPDFDLLVGGFPCQAFSVAGKRRGFDDTRGTLFFDIARILKHKRPRHLVLENVKGLLSHDSGKTLQTIIGVLTDLGYRVEWQVLNSKNFGVPQNRERIYIIGHLGDGCAGQVFPISRNDGQDTSPDEGRDTKVLPTIRATHYKNGDNQPVVAIDMTLREKTDFRVRSDKRVGTLDANYYKRIANQERPGVLEGTRIRRLTPRECEALQGFPRDWTKYGIGEEPISDTQRYKMCGNAVTTNAVEAVMSSLIRSCL